jgi:glyoxylase-like metal-dependent hydrolase (beta-lactamase superfamily II)
MHVGHLQVVAVDDGIGRVTPAQLFAAAGRVEPAKGHADQDWADHRAFLDDEGRLEMPVGAFVVRAGDRVVLVDAGYGPVAPPTVQDGGRLLASLANAGVEPADITDVVLTHLHADHIGWSAIDGRAVFPNATYRCDERDWAHFVDGADQAGAPDAHYRKIAADTLGPIAARFEPWSGDTTIAPGITTLHAPGHTPGSTIVVLSSGDARVMLLGDVVHCPVQLLDAEFDRIADVDGDLARRTSERIAAELERDGTAVVGAHFPGLRFGRLITATGRRQWSFDTSTAVAGADR